MADEEIMRGARPKRYTRTPAHLQQYEVQYFGGRPGMVYDIQSTWEAPVHQTPPSSSWSCTTPPGGDLVHSGYPTHQPSSYEPSPLTEYQQSSHGAGFISSMCDRGLQYSHKERAHLMHQQAYHEDLKELKEARSEVRELIKVAHSLKADLTQIKNLSSMRPFVSQFSSAPDKPHESTALAEDDILPDLPPPPWPDADLTAHMDTLILSGRGGTTHQPVMSQTGEHPSVYPAVEPRSVGIHDPVIYGFPPPPTPRELRELFTPVVTPLFGTRPSVQTAGIPIQRRPTPAYSIPPADVPQVKQDLRPIRYSSGFESVYRGPTPTIPRFSRPDPGEFARLRIALENLLPPDGTELFKYQILVDHLKLEEARLIADSYLNSPRPFTDTMAALHDKFGQPHQLALRRIAMVLESPDVKRGDNTAFQKFALQVQSLVGLLNTLGLEGGVELSCGSHVARLLSKLPPEQRADFRRHMFRQPGTVPNLVDLSNWLRYETWCHGYDTEPAFTGVQDKSATKSDFRKKTVTILHGVAEPVVDARVSRKCSLSQAKSAKGRRYCPFCDKTEHYLSQCASFALLSTDQVKAWIRNNNRCWRCARAHHAAQCDLKKPCNLCQGTHLRPLHEVNVSSTIETSANAEKSCLTSSSSSQFYLDKPSIGSRVMLKVVPVNLHYGGRTFDTFALLDDGSERTILLPPAVQTLGIHGIPEDLPLRTIRDDVQVLHGSAISFQISPLCKPETIYQINHAFSADRLTLSRQSYPVEQLQRKYRHLQGLPIRTMTEIQPLLLIGSDHHHLITPIEPVRWGTQGWPAAVHTRLGWTLQGPTSFMGRPLTAQRCLLTSVVSVQDELFQNVQRLWQLDTVPQQAGKEVTRSKQDQDALQLLERKTLNLKLAGVHRLATPLLRRSDMPLLKAPKESVLPILRSVERRLLKDPVKAEVYKADMRKLLESGAVQEVNCDTPEPEECWYIPHHIVSHNGKFRIVFNGSHQFQGQSLNQHLLPGPILGASLLGVLVRFRERPIAICGDIKAMFHQVCLLPEDRPLLRFLWRDLKMAEVPKIFEWQVLPFGMTSSPCCATFALQRLVQQHPLSDETIQFSVEKCFYVDNCLQSLHTADAARHLIDRLRSILSGAGFDIRQWACNDPAVLSHLPNEAQATSVELWLTQEKSEVPESTLGLSWNWQADTLSYKHRPVIYETPTLRNLYKILATQYDPLGWLLPYTTRAKVIIKQLWNKQRGWDDSNLPPELLQSWNTWEDELQNLPQISFPRSYVPPEVKLDAATHELHIFSDASEQAYGAVAYLRTTDQKGQHHLSFILARSRVTPKRSHSIPRLELCGSLVAAQLAKLLGNELTLPIQTTFLWTDSTTVLMWLTSESCRYRVFVGNRVAEIQELTEKCSWRYVNTLDNPADDVTKGKPLHYLTAPNRWAHGPSFLLKDYQEWPEIPNMETKEEKAELRKSAFCGVTNLHPSSCSSDGWNSKTWQELLNRIALEVSSNLATGTPPEAEEYRKAEVIIIKKAQQESFPDDYQRLIAGKSVRSGSRLVTLAPEIDSANGLIRVGGRLRRAAGVEPSILHPLVLDPNHPVTRLIIHHYDHQLHHSGSERLFAQIRRYYWILRGREAIRRFQQRCLECQRWRAKPTIPKMSDLPIARLQLHKPAFHSCGVDCFGPLLVKIGRRTEKRWGILFKCLTTRAVHLDLVPSMSTDSFLMSLRRFVARRGTPAELWSDQGTNFRGGERELREAYAKMAPELQCQLARQRIRFHFNPPSAPHFGGIWEREIRSVKSALYTVLGSQPIPEEVLTTVLLEVEAIINSKPLGYVSSDVADTDPVTPNSLLMGRPDTSLSLVVYPESEMLSRKRWRHSQILADQFWSRFIREYLPSLQTRQKWQASPPDLQEKTFVMILDPQLPRSIWPIGQVIKTHLSPDGHVRSADVKVKDHVYTRPVARLVILPALPEDASTDPSTD